MSCKNKFHINILYNGGEQKTIFSEYMQSITLLKDEKKYGKSLIVRSSDWVGYEDTVKPGDSKFYVMMCNGAFISIEEPTDVDKEYSSECVIVKITNIN